MITSRRDRSILIVSVLVIIVSVLFWTGISGDFVYGQAHEKRPIIPFLISYLTAGLAFTTVFILKKNGTRIGIPLIISVGLLVRIILIPSNLIQENDVYRYILDGHVLLNGGNPYEFSPNEIKEKANPLLSDSLNNADAEIVISRIGYPHIPTIYPPLAQLLFLIGAFVGSWDWMGMRFLFLLIDLGTGGLLFLLLRLKRIDPDWLFLYAWNPLVLKEITNSAHLDIAVAASLLGLIFALDQFEKTGRFRFLFLSSLFMAGSVLLKIYPVILIPACCFIFIRQKRFREQLLFLLFIFLLIGLSYLPFIGIGLDRITEGLTTFSRYWRMNDGIYGLLSGLTLHARMITAGLIGTISFFVPYVRKTSRFSDIGGDLWWVLLFWFLLIPTPFPWYAIPLCALIVIQPDQELHRILLVLTGALALYYLSFFYEYRSFAGYWWTLTRVIEHSLIWSVILYTLIKKLSPIMRGQSDHP